MSAEMSVPLTFATFFTCGIKQFTNLTQLNCINLLLTGHLISDSNDILSDSVCSNYAKGKKDLTNSLRVDLANLTIDAAKDRLSKSAIQDFTIVAKVLAVLLKNAALSENEKNRLLKYYTSEDKLTFIAQVFLTCLKGDNFTPLNNSLISILESYRYNIDMEEDTGIDDAAYLNNGKNAASTIINYNAATENNNKNSEDFDWMRVYVPGCIINTPPAFIRSKIKIENVLLTLPQDYAAIIYALKPMLTESTYRHFMMKDFTNVMNIDVNENKYNLQAGSLEYFRFEGEIESILAALKCYDFSEMSDFAFQLIGEFTENDVANLEKHLINSSNAMVNILTALIFDREQATVHLTVFAHRCTEKVNAQKSGRPFDGTHKYILQRDRGTNQ